MAGLIHLLCVKSYVDLTKVLRPNHYCRGRRMKGWVRVDVGTSFLRPEPSNEFPVSIDTQTTGHPPMYGERGEENVIAGSDYYRRPRNGQLLL
jgi:hypothetical protein